MKVPPVKKGWIDIAIEIQYFHITQCKDEPDWTIEKTARNLNRSIGSVSQYLLIANWLKTHEKQIRRFKSINDALEFVRSRQREMRLEI